MLVLSMIQNKDFLSWLRINLNKNIYLFELCLRYSGVVSQTKLNSWYLIFFRLWFSLIKVFILFWGINYVQNKIWCYLGIIWFSLFCVYLVQPFPRIFGSAFTVYIWFSLFCAYLVQPSRNIFGSAFS